MSDNTEIIDFLRVRFARVDDALQRIDQRLDELTGRAGRMERMMADLHVQMAEHSIRMDRIGSDVERIKRRLDLVDAPGGR